ncbi:hypothetical protein BDZ85DRAFT_26301 [Elsinoe ampelina]|uniref:SET domain-containing protein n=1 Tax=Elsinoe ampelina TaxID=302913 RepID=A0A6A6G471_9PEZI|nr:hypothetical protein BDZ85DRAFT_26301 [Elsinoe ampelina]
MYITPSHLLFSTDRKQHNHVFPWCRVYDQLFVTRLFQKTCRAALSTAIETSMSDQREHHVPPRSELQTKSQKKNAKRRAKKAAQQASAVDDNEQSEPSMAPMPAVDSRVPSRDASIFGTDYVEDDVFNNPWRLDDYTNDADVSSLDLSTFEESPKSQAQHASETFGENGNDDGTSAAPKSMYELRRDTPGQLAVHATGCLLRGQRILCEKPLHVYNHQSPDPSIEVLREVQKLPDDIFNHFSNLRYNDHSHAGRFRKDSSNVLQPQGVVEATDLDAIQDLSDCEQELLEIWKANRRFIDQTLNCGSIVAAELSRFRHSCRPNAEYHWNEETGHVTLHLTKGVRRGEEITISYLHPVMLASDTRKDKLKHYFGIACQMPCCQNTNQTNSPAAVGRYEPLEASILNYHVFNHTAEQAGLLTTLDKCISYCNAHHLASAAISYYLSRARTYAITNDLPLSLDDYQEAYDLVVLTHGVEHPFARKLLVMTSLLLGAQNDATRYRNITSRFSSPKHLPPISGAPEEILEGLRELHRRWNVEQGLATHEKVMETPWDGSVRERPVLRRKWTR